MIWSHSPFEKRSLIDFQIGNERKREFRAAEIRFYLHKEFCAAEIRFCLHKEFRAAEIVGGRLRRKLLFSKGKIGERLRIFGFFNRAMLMII